MYNQKANPSTTNGRDYITSTEEASSRASMETVMMAEGEGVSVESPTTVKEPIHCWMKSSEENPGCRKEPGDRRLTPRGWAKGVDPLTGYPQKPGRGRLAGQRPGRGEPAGLKPRGGSWSYRYGIRKVRNSDTNVATRARNSFYSSEFFCHLCSLQFCPLAIGTDKVGGRRSSVGVQTDRRFSNHHRRSSSALKSVVGAVPLTDGRRFLASQCLSPSSLLPSRILSIDMPTPMTTLKLPHKLHPLAKGNNTFHWPHRLTIMHIRPHRLFGGITHRQFSTTPAYNTIQRPHRLSPAESSIAMLTSDCLSRRSVGHSHVTSTIAQGLTRLGQSSDCLTRQSVGSHALGMAFTAQSLALYQGSSTLRLLCRFPSHSLHLVTPNSSAHIRLTVAHSPSSFGLAYTSEDSRQLTDPLSLHCSTIWQHNGALQSPLPPNSSECLLL
eukprot:Gb_32898 [translate_table: standard]